MCTHTLIITEFVQRSFVNRELQALPSMSMMALYFIRSSKGIRFAAIVWFDRFCHSQPWTNEVKPASIISGRLMLFFTSLALGKSSKSKCVPVVDPLQIAVSILDCQGYFNSWFLNVRSHVHLENHVSHVSLRMLLVSYPIIPIALHHLVPYFGDGVCQVRRGKDARSTWSWME